jgi:hypothetical protein
MASTEESIRELDKSSESENRAIPITPVGVRNGVVLLLLTQSARFPVQMNVFWQIARGFLVNGASGLAFWSAPARRRFGSIRSFISRALSIPARGHHYLDQFALQSKRRRAAALQNSGSLSY